jgi:hypothetical protein
LSPSKINKYDQKQNILKKKEKKEHILCNKKLSQQAIAHCYIRCTRAKKKPTPIVASLSRRDNNKKKQKIAT